MMDYVSLERLAGEGFERQSSWETFDVLLISKQTCFLVICAEGHISDM